jgi:hypothetical protein
MAGAHSDQYECNVGADWFNGMNVGVTIGDTSRHNEWYVSYYLRLDELWASPHGTENYKFTNWEQGVPRSTIYSYPNCYEVLMSCNCGDGSIERAAPACNLAYINGPAEDQVVDYVTCGSISSGNCGAPWQTHDYNKINPKYAWTKWEHELNWSGNDYKASVNNKTMIDTSLSSGCTLNASRTTPSAITIGGFFKSGLETGCPGGHYYNDDNYRYFADVYVDTTLSRIMIGNASTYSACTILEPQIPSAWTSSSITATVNLGSLVGADAKYLYVFDSANTPSAGYFLSSDQPGSCTLSTSGTGSITFGSEPLVP